MKTGPMCERNRKIVEDISAGVPWKEVAREHGLSSSRLGQILLRGRGQVAVPYEVLSPEEIARIVVLALDNNKVSLISQSIGRSESAIRRVLDREGIVPSKGPRIATPGKRTEAVRLVQEGLTYSKVAEALEISRGVVAGAIHRWKKERQRHDGLPKVSKLQRSPSQGQSSHREGQLHPEKARV